MELCCSHLRALFVAREPAADQGVDKVGSAAFSKMPALLMGRAGFVRGHHGRAGY